MKVAFNILRVLSRHAWWWSAAFIVLLALLVTAARLLLPQLGHYKDELEMQLSAAIGQPVSVSDFEIGWHGYGPRLFLHDVKLLDRSGKQALFGFEEAHIDVSLPSTLYRFQIALRDLTLTGIDLTVIRDVDGQTVLEGLALPEGGGNNNGGDSTALIEWLLRQDNLAIEDSILHLDDRRQGTGMLTLKRVNLFLRNEGEFHTLSGQVKLPSTVGGVLRVIARAEGPLSEMQHWPVDIYLQGTSLQLAQWLADRPGLGMRLVSGNADVQLWGRWQDNRLDNLKGNLTLHNLYLAPDKQIPALDQDVQTVRLLFGEFDWQHQARGWALDVDRLRLEMEGGGWQPARLHVQKRTTPNGDEVEVASSFARIDDLAALLALNSHLSDEQREMLVTAKPRGELHNGYLKLRLRDAGLQDYFVRARFDDLALLPWRKLPGFDGVDLLVNMDRSGGVADIGTRGAYLDFSRLFRNYFVVDEMLGRLAWARRDDGVQLDLRKVEVANPDAALRLDGQLFFPADGNSPLVKLLVDIKRANGEATSRYLPVAIMHENAVKWLDHGIVAGDVTSGAMLLQGPIKHFPFKDGSGRFEVRFNVSNGILDYKEGWPRAEQIEARVGFIGNRMELDAVAGKILSADVQRVRVEIPDMRAHPAELQLRGKAVGSSENVVRYLNESPLAQKLGNFTEGASADGRSTLDLSLDIPLKHGAEVTTRGVIGFSDSTLDLKRFGVDLSGMTGEVVFTGKGLAAQGVKATVLGQPTQLDIRTEEVAPGESAIIFDGNGESRYAELAKRIDLPVFPYLQGNSAWRAQLEIPRAKLNGLVPTLSLESDLIGTRVTLPAPLAKEAQEKGEFKLRARFEEKRQHWLFDYDNQRLTGVFDLPHEKAQARGELRFSSAATLPVKPGLRIAGTLDRFVYDDWQPLIVPDKQEAERRNGTMRVNQLDMQAGEAELLGQRLSDVAVEAEYGEGVWQANVTSKEMSGKVWLPENWNNLLEMDLDHLYLARKPEQKKLDTAARAAARAEAEKLDPRVFPPLTVHSKDTRYGDLDLGQVELKTRKLPTGFSVESFTSSSKIVATSAQGVWLKSKQNSSVVKADLKVKDLGALLAGLGYVETIKGGKGTGRLALKWDGPLIDYDLASMNGAVDFNFKDGRLLEVDPGAGRFFGLLSIQMLPRRLMLDFSDIFGKGFAFDDMRSHFDIRNGDAFTDNFRLDGPAAEISLNGRVGLVQEDYDQRVKVMPHVGSGLPTIAGILTGQVAPALVLALVEKLTKPDVEKATGIYYQVTGSWDKPQIEPVDVVKADGAAEQK